MPSSALPPTSSGISFPANGFIDSRPRTELLTGRARFTLLRNVETEVAPSSLVPEDFELVYDTDEPGCRDRWYVGPRGGFLLGVYTFGVRVFLTSMERHHVDEVFAEVTDRAGVPNEQSRRVRIWHLSESDGPSCEPRRLEAERWTDLARNYPSGTRAQLDGLMQSTAPEGTGRLLLWHGEPGTGKTSAALALIDAWYPWCTPHVVTDPERMFGDANYLLHIMGQSVTSEGTGVDPDLPKAQRWKLIVCEDADEYLRSDARARSGPALGRLLNATDGLLGRGTRTLVLLTTNDELGRLHPAVTRPGRCLSLVDFPRFSKEEATLWLGQTTQSATLAELFQHRETGVPAAAHELVGAYL